MSRPSFIEPMLVCSTAHVLPATMAWITSHSGCVYPNEYGAFVWVPDLDASHDAEEDEDDLPADLAAIFALAREYDCCWIKLDADAAEIEALPTYDWGERIMRDSDGALVRYVRSDESQADG